MNNDREHRITKGLPQDQLINLDDLDFDFEDFFERHREESNMTVEESEEFSARVYGMFCRDVFRSGGNDTVTLPFWVANYIAEKLVQPLGGCRWEEIMDLPWDEPEPFLTPRGQRVQGIYFAVENYLKSTPGAAITTLIYEESQKRNVSFETARADYYAYKKIVEQGAGLPSKYINPNF